MVALIQVEQRPNKATAPSVPDNLDSINLKGVDEVCPAGLAKHAQQTRQSMPSRRRQSMLSKPGKAWPAGQTEHAQQDGQSLLKRTGKACPAGRTWPAEKDRQSKGSRRPTWNLEVISKCFFMSVPKTWLTITGLKRAVSLDKFCSTDTSD